MLNELTAPQAFNKQEPIPGYVIKELIGSGGYGEVWKAHAPGGLVKAIKFVYGNSTSKRAARELRALNRIKEARHAFLLSIERIEVIDGNVVIVTELADESLKEHCNKYHAAGQPGIPRDELLAYLRDAADALDYIYEGYSLQHLDIKPENLLLVGNRAKVADFGLIKNLYDRSASLIEGLTPIYSPPELFAGKPNRHSDQYSLAIVYQEMLTGQLPFNGQTAAHLAAQHLQTAPTLSALPKCDQTVVARALSKDPDERYPSCRDLIAALIEVGHGETAERVVRKPAPPAPLFKTEQLEGLARPMGQTQVLSEICADLPTDLPAIDLDENAAAQHGPVLYIGIGGTATRVLQRLRRRFHDRIGAMAGVPAVEFLLLDTDVRSINRATDGEGGTALLGSETLAMPLRRTEAYRPTANRILGSISRRWLYNIPFSLQTEGFRPLGRLAMVDHCPRLLERLRQSLTSITDPESIATTARTTGLDFSAHPRVFVVASTAGGSGGGMVVDVAYAVRTILAELSLSDESVCGVLMHSTPRAAADRDKAVANSYATLNELWHYSRAGHSYPGDSSCRLPAFHGNNRTFSNCYFVHLGDDLTEQRLDAATDPVAEYLYASSITPAARFFDKCRQLEQSQPATSAGEPLLRTFGLCQLGGSNSDIPALVAELLCRDLVNNWRTGTNAPQMQRAPRLSETMALIAAHDARPPSLFVELDREAANKAVEWELDLKPLRAAAREMLDQEVGCDIERYFVKLVGEAFEAQQADGERRDVNRVFSIIDAVLGDNAAEDDHECAFDSLGTVLKMRLEGRAGKHSAAVREWIFDLVDEPDARVEGAKHGASWFQNHLRSLERAAMNNVSQVREQITAIKDATLGEDAKRRQNAGGPRTDARWLRELQPRMVEYARLRLDQVMTLSVAHAVRVIEGQVTAALDRLQEFWKDLNRLGGMFQVTQSLDEVFGHGAADDAVHEHWRSLMGDLMEHRQQLMVALDRAMAEDPAFESGGLRHFVSHPQDAPTQLVGPLRAAARSLILRAMEGLNMTRLSDGAEGSSSLNSGEFTRCIEAARPYLAHPAAGSRLLLMVPKSLDDAGIRARFADDEATAPTIVHTEGGDLIACQEVEQLYMRKVGKRLVGNRRDYIELAKRLHTRVDVEWEDMSKTAPPVI